MALRGAISLCLTIVSVCLAIVLVSTPVTGYVNAEVGRAAMLNSSIAKVSANRCGIPPPTDGFFAVVNCAAFGYEDACGMMIEVTCTAAPGQPSKLCFPGNTNSIVVPVIGCTDYQADKTITIYLSEEAFKRIVDPNADPNKTEPISVNFRKL